MRVNFLLKSLFAEKLVKVQLYLERGSIKKLNLI